MSCLCGCGGAPSPGRNFIHGHNGRRPLRERVFSRLIIDPSGCLIWTGKPASTGYGQVEAGGRGLYAHRLMYEWFVGPIPSGTQIDHLCRNRLCAAPAHLEAVSRKTNILRGVGPSANQARMDHCQRGHEFDLLNTYWRSDRHGGRQCRACNRDSQRARRAGKKG